MRRGQPSKDPKRQARPRSQPPLPSMATPRRPQGPKKSGFFAFVLMFGVMGGFIWLMMLILGWGPYATGEISTKPTQTMISVIVLGDTPTLLPTRTLAPTLTLTTTPTLAPTVTPSPTFEVMPYILIGEQETLSSALIRPGLGCDWLIIAGQVWNLQDAPVKGMNLHLFGELDGYSIESFALSGSASDYGESGYEFTLENLRVASEESLYIQLVDVNGVPFSHPYSIQTFEDCQKNLILINFKQVR